MGLANQSIRISNCVDLGNNGPTVELTNRPTLIVSRSTSQPARQSISFAGGIQVLNFISGVNAILQTATMVGGLYVFVNTQPGVVTLALDNNGTVGGQAIYTLAWGAPVKFFFDGTNLN